MEIDPLDFSDSPQDMNPKIDIKDYLVKKLSKDLSSICDLTTHGPTQYYKLSLEKLYTFLNTKFSILCKEYKIDETSLDNSSAL